jgi:hypothetical protein
VKDAHEVRLTDLRGAAPGATGGRPEEFVRHLRDGFVKLTMSEVQRRRIIDHIRPTSPPAIFL